MHFAVLIGNRKLLAIACSLLVWTTVPGRGQTTHGQDTNAEIRIVEVKGLVEVLLAGSTRWVRTQTNQLLEPMDHIRTGPNSRATVRWPDQSIVPFGPLTEAEIVTPYRPGQESGLHLLRGILSFLHWHKPTRFQLITRGGVAGINGTEFVLRVEPVGDTERTTLSLIDGEVVFTNDHGRLTLSSGEQAIAEPGLAPKRTPGFTVNINNVAQWSFYYPAVLDPDELPLTAKEREALGDSIAKYRSGDLLEALARYPGQRDLISDAERIYHATLLLAAGDVPATEELLSKIDTAAASDRSRRLSSALRLLMATVKNESASGIPHPELATELLASSYYEQSRALGDYSLKPALELARRATGVAPGLGFAWERLAELEFSFGRVPEAERAVEKSLTLSPRNAQGLALRGFLFAARNRTTEAIAWFNRAIEADSGLANAWLGRGLCRIHQGDLGGGQEDLLLAAALEPQRAALRSYVGKAYGESGDYTRAAKELKRAKQLDPNDPTAWLYSALLNEQHNRINEAIDDLEQSQAVNNNRRVYRSDLLLDQDRAVRSANLARIYQEAGLDDVAVQEASRAVTADYGNYSAHLFLANSYEQTRQANWFDLRYETPAFSEYLIASLLGPADGRLLAQPVTQQEYTKLFERDTLGLSTSTEYLSRGAWNQYLAQYGTVRNTSYAVEFNYLSDPGETPNGSLETWQLSFKAKQMLTPQDGLFFEVLDFSKTSGDLAQRYDPNEAVRGLEAHEKQEPSVLAGLDHLWSDTQRTLFLVSRFDDKFDETNPHGATFLLGEAFAQPIKFTTTDLTQFYQSDLTLTSFELQHLVEFGPFQTIAGVRFQDGTQDLSNKQTLGKDNAANLQIYFGNPGDTISQQSFSVDFTRLSPYVYEYWRALDGLWLMGGVSYDYQSQPNNPLFAPLDTSTRTFHEVSPKAGLIWAPTPRATVRLAYSRSLGGVDLAQSVRLEPTQMAGFVQTFRNLIPDALAGGLNGATFETADVSLEYRFPTRTYVALRGEWLHSTADQDVGAFDSQLFADYRYEFQTLEQLRFRERSLDASVHQLLGDWFSASFRYRLSDAELTQTFPQIPPGLGQTHIDSEGLLHLFSVQGRFEHPSGFFAAAEANWWAQALSADLAGLPGDNFWQMNLLAGYRSPRRHLEVSVGLLNVTDQDYRLHPINLYPNIPRARTLVTQLQLNF